MGSCACIAPENSLYYPNGDKIESSIVVYHGTSACAA